MSCRSSCSAELSWPRLGCPTQHRCTGKVTSVTSSTLCCAAPAGTGRAMARAFGGSPFPQGASTGRSQRRPTRASPRSAPARLPPSPTSASSTARRPTGGAPAAGRRLSRPCALPRRRRRCGWLLQTRRTSSPRSAQGGATRRRRCSSASSPRPPACATSPSACSSTRALARARRARCLSMTARTLCCWRRSHTHGASVAGRPKSCTLQYTD
mmetsp:Transcript_5754/g.19092  ORF Transcript_5754/g.19092 Transcript_5754/m.19092 type:complete len:212 (-) Transcript_5754:835-1470(-)